MTFKRSFSIVPLLAALILAPACSTVEPSAGQEAVLVEKPMFFGHGGVVGTPIKTGLEYVALSTTGILVPTTPLQFQEHFEDLMSSDGVPLDFDASIRLQITDSVKMVRDFAFLAGEQGTPRWYAINVSQPFRNLVRQEVRNHGMNETAISSSAVDKIDAVVTAQLTKLLADIGLPVRLIDLTVGRANPPDAIKNQRVATAEQEQRANTEKQRALAEEQRIQSETKRAQADNAYRNAMDLSPEQFLRLEQIHTQRDICAKGGCTYISAGSGVTPLVNVK